MIKISWVWLLIQLNLIAWIILFLDLSAKKMGMESMIGKNIVDYSIWLGLIIAALLEHKYYCKIIKFQKKSVNSENKDK